MKRFLYSILIIAAVSGCGVCRRCPQGGVTQVDSVYVERTVTTTVHDTVIQWRIPQESSSSVLPDTDTSRLRTGLAESEAWVKDGRLHHALRNRSDITLPILIPIPVTAIETNHGLLRTRTVTVEVEKELTRWQRLCLTVGQWSVAVLLVLAMAGIIALVSKISSLFR